MIWRMEEEVEEWRIAPRARVPFSQNVKMVLVSLMFDATLVCDNNTRYKLGVISRQVLVSRLSVIIQNIHHH